MGMGTVEQRVIAALWSLPGIGRKSMAKLASHGAMAQWHTVEPARLLAAIDWSPQARSSISTVTSLAAVADALETALGRLGHDLVFAQDPKYPERLAELDDAPPVLFAVGPGAAVPPKRRIGMVGTRHPDADFVERARHFVELTASHGVGIVSGGAEGIDQCCHGAALRAGAETWAFLGCAIEQIDAAQRVLVTPFRDRGGTLFSEFPPGARPAKATFPRRNRLISGSSDALLILRAPKGSGALHTARYAQRQSRPILAMPGDFYNSAAEGCNALLKQGVAQLCLEPNDILRAAGLTAGDAAVKAPVNFMAGPLSEESKHVLQHIPRTPIDFEGLLEAARCDSGVLTAALLELELANRVVKRSGRRYEKL
jgi:DNA processing protein